MAQNESGRRSQRGFAAMNEEERREIARRGGRAAHERGTAHEWDSREASEAARRRNRGSRYEARYENKDKEQTKGVGEKTESKNESGKSVKESEPSNEKSSRRGFSAVEPEGKKNRTAKPAEEGADEELDEEDEGTLSRKARRSRMEDEEDAEEYESAGTNRGGRGFAAVDPESKKESSRRSSPAAGGRRGPVPEEDFDDDRG